MALIQMTIEREGFETIELRTDGQGPFGLLQDTVGLGAPPVITQYLQGAGDGGTEQSSRHGMQILTLPVVVLGSDRADTSDLLRLLYRMLRKGTNLPRPRLVASYSTGEVYELAFNYESGLELAHADALPTRYVASLSLTCPTPFWTSRDSVAFTVSSEAASAELQDDLAAMVLGSGTAIGFVQVTNPGDEDAFLDWDIVGPASGDVSVDIDGVGWVFTSTLTESESRHVDGRRKTILDGAGGNRYDEFGPAPKFPMLPPGESMVGVQMEGADPGEWVPSDVVLYTNRLIEPTLKATRTKWATWSNGAGTESHLSSGFAGGTAGYMQLSFAGAAVAKSAIMFDISASVSEVLSPQMVVMVSATKTVQGGLWFFDALGNVLAAAFGPYVEVPANTTTRVGLPGDALGAAPAGTVRVRFVVSTVQSSSTDWMPGGWFRASFGAVTASGSVLAFFNGASPASDWTGLADQSTSVQYALELVGQSSLSGKFRPRKALVY